PGIVLRTGAPLTTESVDVEADFLRSRVKALSYRGLACVPLRSGEEVRGSLLLAWKRPDADLERAVRIAALVARPILATVEAACARLHLARTGPQSELLAEAAEQMRAAAGADAA